jgi:subtilase family serine protease
VTSTSFRLVLSTDTVISQSDRYLYGAYWSASRGNYNDVVRRSITIPASTPAGYYYVGAVIDLNNQISEYDEGNNAVRFSKRIYVKKCS